MIISMFNGGKMIGGGIVAHFSVAIGLVLGTIIIKNRFGIEMIDTITTVGTTTIL